MKVYYLYLNGDEEPSTYPENALDGLLEELKSSEAGDWYKVEIAEMTKEEFEKLPEFNGW